MIAGVVARIMQRRGVRQLVKFSMVGVINTLIDFTVYVVLTRVFGLFFMAANVVAILTAMSFSFYANKTFTFRNTEKKFFSQYSKVVIINVVGFLLHNAILYILVTEFAMFDIFAKISAVIIVLGWNFLTQKYWAFAHKRITENMV